MSGEKVKKEKEEKEKKEKQNTAAPAPAPAPPVLHAPHAHMPIQTAPQVHVHEERPTYTRMARRHLSLEALNRYGYDYQLDQVSFLFLLSLFGPVSTC